MKMPSMVDMKMSKADMKEEQTAAATPAMDPYPWGLRLNLDSDELDKLGVTDLPKVGTEYYICAIGKVTRVNSSAAEGEDKERRGIEVQIVQLCLDPEMEQPGEKTDTPKAEKKEARGAASVMSNAYRGL